MLLDLTQVTRMHGLDPVWMVLVVGAITFILGFAGCVGALRENICLLKFVRLIPSWTQGVTVWCGDGVLVTV